MNNSNGKPPIFKNRSIFLGIQIAKTLNKTELKEFLDAKVIQYNRPDFITSDPIQIPHLFSKKEDIEIAGFLTATIAWGNRKSIINNANKMMEIGRASCRETVEIWEI